MKRIIASSGYMGSGSSAITDLVAEFASCNNCFKSTEYVFLHCPDGVFDLEDQLLIGNNAIKSDAAIRAFEKQMFKLYDKKHWWVGHYNKIMTPDFKKDTETFIEKITQFHYKGYWYNHEDVDLKMFMKLLIRKPIKIFSRKKMKPVLKYSDGMRVSFIKPEQFYAHAKDYIYTLINKVAGEDENVILDQLLLPFNMHRVDHYFGDELKAIVVERDPRDVYILNKYTWAVNGVEVPMPQEVNQFCAYYKQMRESEKLTETKKVLRIRFEDLVYQYEEMIEKVREFLEFQPEEHVRKKERFNPDISIKNTQLFRKPGVYDDEIKIIEKELEAYLYPFPYSIENDVKHTVEFE